jgi:hypothetical protein
MDLNEIDTYLQSSRNMIDVAKRRIAGMGFCCPGVFLGDIESRQNELERQAWLQRQRRSSLGYFWLVAGAITGIAALGTYVYNHYLSVKEKTSLLTCIEELRKEGKTAEEASRICNGATISGDLTKTIQIVIYGGVAMLALYVISKIIIRKR